MAYGADNGIYAIRGFYESESPMDILLWLGTNVLYPVMVIFLAAFLTIPFLRQSKGATARTVLWIVAGSFVVVAVFNWFMIETSPVTHTYTDVWTLPHYRFDNAWVPNAYILTLALDVAIGLYSVVLLAITARRESDIFYKRKAQLIMCGWFIAIPAQLLLLVPSLTIANPPFNVLATLMMSLGVLRTKPA